MNVWSFLKIRAITVYVVKDGGAFLYFLWFLLSSCGLLFYSVDCVLASFTTPWLLHTAHPLSGVTVQNEGHVHLFAICSGKNWRWKSCSSTLKWITDNLHLATLIHISSINKQINEWRNTPGFSCFLWLCSLPQWELPAESQYLRFSFVPISFFLKKRSASKRRSENSNQHVWVNLTVISYKLWFRARHL